MTERGESPRRERSSEPLVPESCDETVRPSRSVDRGSCGPGMGSRKDRLGSADADQDWRKATLYEPRGARLARAPRDRRPVHVGKRHVWEPGDPASVCGTGSADRGTKPEGHKVSMNGRGKSDSPVVPEKLSNNACDKAAERVEGRGLAKGNLREDGVFRTQSRVSTQSGLERVREAECLCVITRGRSRMR